MRGQAGRSGRRIARAPDRRGVGARTAAPTRAEAARALAVEIEACRRCPLGASRTRAVVYRGSLRPRVLFVGEAPGKEEDRTGVPFVGRSGGILDAAIRRLGPGLASFGVLNVLKCRPPGNRFDPAAARTCRPFLDRQLKLLRPELLVTLGSVALRTVAPEAPAVMRAAGRPLSSPAGPVFPLLHPAATLRSRRNAERWAADVARLGGWLRAHRRETA